MPRSDDTLDPLAGIEELAQEVDRYLATVDLFRAEGHEPVWQPERPAPVAEADDELVDVEIPA